MSTPNRGFFARLVEGWRRRWIRGPDDASLDEVLDAYDEVVRIIAVDPSDPTRGRILYRGTTWDAMSLESELAVDCNARIVGRDNLCWLVDPESTGTPSEHLTGPDSQKQRASSKRNQSSDSS